MARGVGSAPEPKGSDPASEPPEAPAPGPAGLVQQTLCFALSLVMQNAAAAQQRDHLLAQAVVSAGVRRLDGRGAEPPAREPGETSEGRP